MQHSAAGVLALELVLEVQGLEDVVRKAHGQLGGIGIIGLLLAGGDDIRIALLVQPGQAVAGALGGGGLQVVHVAGLLLEAGDHVPHKIQGAQGEVLALWGGDVLAQEVEAGLVHADQADGVKMVVPIVPGALLHIREIMGGIGIHAPLGLLLDGFALDLQALFGDLHLGEQPVEIFLFRAGQVADPGQVDGDHADGAGHGIGAEEAAAPLAQFAGIQPQPAAHG